jgi:TM2 domain-containing membrane protein YozV
MTEFPAPAAPPGAPGAPHVVHHHYHPQKSGGTAALLEILPGIFLQTFGIGHIYAGNVGTGLLFMFGYWMLAAVNLLLCFVLIGFFTWPVCWIAVAIVSTLMAANAVRTPLPSQR